MSRFDGGASGPRRAGRIGLARDDRARRVRRALRRRVQRARAPRPAAHPDRRGLAHRGRRDRARSRSWSAPCSPRWPAARRASATTGESTGLPWLAAEAEPPPAPPARGGARRSWRGRSGCMRAPRRERVEVRARRASRCAPRRPRVGVLGDRQEVEDPAAAVVRRRRPCRSTPARRAASSPPSVVQQRDARRSAARSAGPWRGGARAPTRPRRRCRSRRGWPGSAARFADCGKHASTSRIGIEELTQTSAPSGSSGSSAGEQPRLERLRRRRRAPPAPARRPRASDSSQPGSRLRRDSTPRERVERRRAAAPPAPARRSGWARARRACGSTTTCAASASQARSGFEVGMSPTRRTSSGRCSAAKRARPQQHVVVGDHVRAVVGAAAHARRWARRAPASRVRAPGRAPARPRLARLAADDHPARAAAIARASSATSSACGARACSRSSVQGRPSGAALPVLRVELLGRRRERLAQREVEVHRARAGRRAAVHQARQASARWWIGASRARARGCPPRRTTWPRCRRA